MRSYALLLLAAFALNTRALTIPEKAVPEHRKTIEEAETPKSPVEEFSSQQGEVNAINDADSLRVVKDIPVKVIVEDVPVLKSAEEGNEVSQEALKKIREEVKDPGAPQRQEHETQNPEHHVDATFLEKTIQETQEFLGQGFKGVSDGINNFIGSNDQVGVLHANLQALQKSFGERIQQLNATIVNFITPESLDVSDNEAESQIKKNFQKIELRLQSLENSFNEGVKGLVKGVESFGTVKADGDNTESTSGSSESTNQVAQIWQNVQQSFSDNWSNFVSTFQNPQGSSPEGAQSDEGTTTNRPFFQVNPIQQFFSGFINSIRPTEKPDEEKPTEEKPSEEKPTEDKPTEEKPSEEKPEKKPDSEEPPKRTGPIREILQRNPIVKGISQAVQRIQQNINNPVKQKETNKKDPEKVESLPAAPVQVEPVEPVKTEVDAEQQQPEKTEEEKVKGLILLHGYGGHGGERPGARDHIDSGVGLKDEVEKEPTPEIVKDEPAKEPENKTE